MTTLTKSIATSGHPTTTERATTAAYAATIERASDGGQAPWGRDRRSERRLVGLALLPILVASGSAGAATVEPPKTLIPHHVNESLGLYSRPNHPDSITHQFIRPSGKPAFPRPNDGPAPASGGSGRMPGDLGWPDAGVSGGPGFGLRLGLRPGIDPAFGPDLDGASRAHGFAARSFSAHGRSAHSFVAGGPVTGDFDPLRWTDDLDDRLGSDRGPDRFLDPGFATAERLPGDWSLDLGSSASFASPGLRSTIGRSAIDLPSTPIPAPSGLLLMVLAASGLTSTRRRGSSAPVT